MWESSTLLRRKWNELLLIYLHMFKFRHHHAPDLNMTEDALDNFEP